MSPFILLVVLPLCLASPDMEAEPELQHWGRHHCIKSCDNRRDGDYMSCEGCDIYATCANGILYDNRACPQGLFWNDKAKRCDYQKYCWPEVFRTVACERRGHALNMPNLYLRCPEGKVIDVIDALYGRMNKDVCPAPFNHVENNKCGDRPADKIIVSKMCNGKNFCDVAPVNRVFGDPCPGTYKYLKVYHICVKA